MSAVAKKKNAETFNAVTLSKQGQAEREWVDQELQTIFNRDLPEHERAVREREGAINERIAKAVQLCVSKELFKSTHEDFDSYLKWLLKGNPQARSTVYKQANHILVMNRLRSAGIESPVGQTASMALRDVPTEKLPQVIEVAKQDPKGLTDKSVRNAVKVVSPESVKPKKKREQEEPKLSLYNPEPEPPVMTAAPGPTISASSQLPKADTEPKAEPVETRGRDQVADFMEYVFSQDPLMQQAIANRVYTEVHKKAPVKEPEQPKPAPAPEPKAPEVIISYEPEAVVKHVLSCPTDVQVSMVTKIIAKTNETARQDVITYIACSESVAFLSHKLPDGKGKNLNRLLSARYNKFVEPTVEEIQSYLNEKKYDDIDAEEFHASYERQGWKLANGNQLTNWKAAVTTWRKMRDKDSKKQNLSKIHPDVYDPSKGLKSGDIL